MFNYILYAAAIVGLGISFFKSKKKTKMALKKAWKSFENIMPQFLFIIVLIGIMLTFLDEATISRLLGEESGVVGMLIAAVVGSVTLIPGFVAFPLAKSLLENGAGYGQITMFVTTLMMVGVVTMPTEMKYFGRSVTIRRNFFAFLYAVVISFVIGGILA